MGTEKLVINVHDEQESDDEDTELLISAFSRDKLSRRRSCSQHVAELLRRIEGKITKKDMEEANYTIDISPCSSNIVPSSMSSKRRDISHCAPRGKISNFIFDNHLEVIWRSVSEDKKSSFALLNSMCFIFYKMGRESGLNLIKRNNIFSKKYVLVPILCWDHWRLVVFCHLGESAQSKARTRCILLLDSMETSAQEIEPDLRKFLLDIFKAEGRPEIKDAIDQIPFLVPKVPQQRNGVDCGRFVLFYIKNFMDDAPENFSLSSGYPYFMRPDWFTPANFEDFCDELDKESPSPRESPPHHSPSTSAVRCSQRIRNKRAGQQRQPPSRRRVGNRTVLSRKPFKPNCEVILID